MKTDSLAFFVAQALELEGHRIRQSQIDACQWFEDTTDKRLRFFSAFRDFSKSTLIPPYIVWRLWKDPKWRIYVLSATPSVASRVMGQCQMLLEEFPQCQEIIRNSNQFSKQILKLDANRTIHPSLSFGSIDKHKTGTRCDEFIADDAEIWEIAGSPTLMDKLKTIYHESFNTSYFRTWVGTFWAMPDISVHKMVLDQIGSTKDSIRMVPWEEGKYPWLPEDRIETMQNIKYMWNTQYLLKFPTSADSIMSAEMLNEYTAFWQGDIDIRHNRRWKNPSFNFDIIPLYRKTEEGDELVYNSMKYIDNICTAWDRATAEGKKDDSVLVTLMRIDKNYFIHKISILPPTDSTGYKTQHRAIVKHMKDLHLTKVHVEEHGDSKQAEHLADDADAMGYPLETVAFYQKVTKEKRILWNIEPELANGKLFYNTDMSDDIVAKLKSQLEGRPDNIHDDIIDALAAAIHQINNTDSTIVHEFPEAVDNITPSKIHIASKYQ